MTKLWDVALDRFINKEKRGAGQPPKFDSPEKIAKRAREYFEWCQNETLDEEKLFAFQGEVTRDTIYHKRPFTQAGLCIFLEISEDTWRNYRKKPEFFEVVSEIDKVIYEQKFSGASVGLFNSSIIARDLGLKDKSEIDHQSSDGSMSPKDAQEAILAALTRKYQE